MDVTVNTSGLSGGNKTSDYSLISTFVNNHNPGAFKWHDGTDADIAVAPSAFSTFYTLAYPAVADTYTLADTASLKCAVEGWSQKSMILKGLSVIPQQDFVSSTVKTITTQIVSTNIRDVIELDANRAVFVYRPGGDNTNQVLYARVYNFNTDTWGAEVTLAASTYYESGTVLVDTDKIATLYTDSAANPRAYKVVVSTIAGETMTVGTPVSTGVTNGGAGTASICKADTNKIFVIIGDVTTATTGHHVVATIAGTVPTFGTDVVRLLSSVTGQKISAEYVSADKIVFVNYANAYKLSVVSISGTVPTVYDTDAGVNGYNGILDIGSGYFVQFSISAVVKKIFKIDGFKAYAVYDPASTTVTTSIPTATRPFFDGRNFIGATSTNNVARVTGSYIEEVITSRNTTNFPTTCEAGAYVCGRYVMWDVSGTPSYLYIVQNTGGAVSTLKLYDKTPTLIGTITYTDHRYSSVMNDYEKAYIACNHVMGNRGGSFSIKNESTATRSVSFNGCNPYIYLK